MRKALVGWLFAVAACGDPRVNFVGHYAGNVTRTTETSAGPSESSSTVDFIITAPASSDRLEFNSACGFTAQTETATTIQFDPISCPTTHGTTVNGATADFTTTYTAGTGSLSNKTLSIDQTGYYVGSNYSDGHVDTHFDFSESVVVTRD